MTIDTKVAPVADDALTEAVKWVRDFVAAELADDTGRIFDDASLHNLRILADAAERSQPEALRQPSADDPVLPLDKAADLQAVIDDAFRRGAEAMREAAADVALPGSKPCGCITKDDDWWQQNCDCSNSGDLAEAQSWCSERNLAERIRALPLPEPKP